MSFIPFYMNSQKIVTQTSGIIAYCQKVVYHNTMLQLS